MRVVYAGAVPQMDGSSVGVAPPDSGQSVEAATRADCQNRLADVPQDEVEARSSLPASRRARPVPSRRLRLIIEGWPADWLLPDCGAWGLGSEDCPAGAV